MGLLKKKIDCSGCEYTGASSMTILGIILWVLALVLFLLSWIIWPLFLIWPLLVVFLAIYPIGQVCPQCGLKTTEAQKPSSKKES